MVASGVWRAGRTMSGLEALVSECARPGGIIVVSGDEAVGGELSDSLERDAVLRHGVEAALPDEGHVAGVGRGEAPGEKGRDSIAADCAHLLCQLTVIHGWWYGGRSGMCGRQRHEGLTSPGEALGWHRCGIFGRARKVEIRRIERGGPLKAKGSRQECADMRPAGGR